MSNSQASPATRTTYLIKRAERGLKSVLDERLRGLGITTNQYTALSVLRVRPGISSAELARRSFVTAQAMNQVICPLEQSGLIRREPDANHQKILRTFLTREGLSLLERCDEVADAVEAALLRGLTPEQVATFDTLLSNCVESLDEIRGRTGLHQLRYHFGHHGHRVAPSATAPVRR